MSAVTITVLRFSVSQPVKPRRTGTVVGVESKQIENKLSSHKKFLTKLVISYLQCSNVLLVQTWLTRDQHHASDPLHAEDEDRVQLKE